MPTSVRIKNKANEQGSAIYTEEIYEQSIGRRKIS
jgi:hypothetical protein